MAAHLLAHEVADLCLGKPPLKSLSVTSTIGEALASLKFCEENCISVWDCDHFKNVDQDCICVGKICMVDIICFLCKKENVNSPSLALKSPVTVLLPKDTVLVRHVQPSTSLLEAIDLILQGAQNLVVPIETRFSGSSRRKLLQKSSSTKICNTLHNGREFCWLTQEDVIRYFLSSIGLFSPLPTASIDALGIISTEFLSVGYDSSASSATEAISRSLVDQTSVAIVDEDGILIGEISPFTLAYCGETVAAAITTLTAGELMAYIDCGGPPEDILRVVKERLKERNLEGMLEEFEIDPSDISSNSSLSDEELPSPTSSRSSSGGRYNKSSSYSARMVRRAEAIVCYRGSSLVAVMVQAIAHRVNYVWVIEEDCSVVGIVTFANMLEVFRDQLESMMLGHFD
ncbi:CBS domain-containing protein CBSX5 isoform X1 [Lycium barbarum]|uniref:CBS domain-containing protein CBSX5 isoform X1 n=1 Tax=Lycium barbarum TaxID=112863 RepID=UPI00293F035B|nr:CBS domain-containing protein CBSX5 isoform X1 [Lycium barbarum]